jgi:cytosine/adenosine deaminase-related metal-dependent hydrolase
VAKRVKIECGTVIAFQQGEHRVLEDGVVVLEGETIVHVGPSFPGEVDEVIDARDLLVTPGFINTHAHLTESPLDKSLVEDVGKRQFYYSGLADMLPARSAAMDEEARRACVDFSMAELIRTGTTTVMEMGGIGDSVADAVERAGLRAYIANGYRSGRWFTRDGKRVEYTWDEEAGLQGFREAVAFIERVDGRANGRIKGFLSPMQVDTCTEELLRLSRQASDSLGVPLALHVSQSVFEFQEMVRRHGLTPVEWLERIGFLGEWNILGHVIFIAGNSWTNVAGDDLAILARHGASVAHCVWVFARRGLAMESFPRYQAAGVNMCLGTDTCPQSMLEALRWTAVIGKIMARQTEVATAADVFDAATLNAARMLHRDDLGRIAPGAKADLLFWRQRSLTMTPLRDPIRNLVYNASADDLRHVMVDGRFLMRDGQLLTVDEQAVVARLQEAGERMWARLHRGDWAGRSVEELSPPSFRAYQA